jgi:hypothetical protein
VDLGEPRVRDTVARIRAEGDDAHARVAGMTDDASMRRYVDDAVNIRGGSIASPVAPIRLTPQRRVLAAA